MIQEREESGMRRIVMFAVLACLLLVVAPATTAEDYEDYEKGGAHDYAFGVGVGLVDPDGDVEPYYTAALRIRLGKHDQSRESIRYGGIQGFIEPEVGYWERDGTSDTLLGVNLLGVVPNENVDYHLGIGAGVHFFDTDVLVAGGGISSESDERFGGNAQFGLDVHFSDAVSGFGTGRFDLVEGSENEVQIKVILGLRFNF